MLTQAEPMLLRARIASTRRVTSTGGEYLLPPIVKVA
jgi:hypothetical protein